MGVMLPELAQPAASAQSSSSSSSTRGAGPSRLGRPGRRSEQRAPPRPQRARSPACAPLRLRLTRHVEQAVTLFSLLQQLALYCHTVRELSARQHMQQAALLALRAGCLALATYLPHRAWLKWR